MSKLITIYLRQGKGKKQLYIAVGLDEETINEMINIEKESSINWDYRGLELLSMACRRLELKKKE